MKVQPLEHTPFGTSIIKVCVIAGSFIIFGGAIIYVKGKEGLLWGLGIILAAGVLENIAIVNILTKFRCPHCGQELKKQLREKSFSCLLCQIEWKLPPK